jgi:hypothetical protein
MGHAAESAVIGRVGIGMEQARKAHFTSCANQRLLARGKKVPILPESTAYAWSATS